MFPISRSSRIHRWAVIIFVVAVSPLSRGAQTDSTTANSSANTGKYPLVEVKERSELSQYGITWKFDHPVKSGQFVNGDWWVIGPVTVVSVTPGPTQGPLPGEVTMKDAITDDAKGITGFMHSVVAFCPPELDKQGTDPRMRNGSMVITKFGITQGYDSRSTLYAPSVSIAFPYKLDADRTLISTVSNAYPIAETNCHPIMWRSEKKQRTLLKAMALLTCLSTQPPTDAFRPAYAGTDKTIYEAKNLRWDLLPKLKLDGMEDYFKKPWLNWADPTCEVATWEDFETYLKPPMLAHYGDKDGFGYVLGYMQPNENQPTSQSACYGRDDTRLVSIISLMLMLDVPKEKKEKLLIELVQRGIDYSGMFKAGTDGKCTWTQDGLKWPIIFASLMLDKPELRVAPQSVPFHEDITTYYGTGWFGQTALWRIVWHDHLIDSDEERSPEQMVMNDHISENYRSYGSSGKAWLGTALAVRYMKACKIWDHDAYFDYCDRWMDEDKKLTDARGTHKRPEWETKTWDPIVDAMWKAFRKTAPEQEMAGNNIMAKWDRQKDGTWTISWVPNPKPTPEEVAAHVDAIHKAYPQVYAAAATPSSSP
jgi:hypothetical protein